MNLQLALVAITIAAAVGYLGWCGWRVLRPSGRQCGGGCACSGSKGAAQPAKSGGLIPSDQLTLRRQKDAAS